MLMNIVTKQTAWRITTTICALILLLNANSVVLAQPTSVDRFKEVKYLKPSDKKAAEVAGELEIDRQKGEICFHSQGTALVKVEKQQVTNLIYERASRPRYVSGLLLAWSLLFTKGKKHFLTIQHKNAVGQGEFTLLHLDKSNYQQILAAVEAATGMKIERVID